MNLFKRKEKRNQELIIDPDLFNQLVTTDKITAEQAMNIPSISSCIKFISDTIASLPIKLYKEDGEQTEEQKDYRLKLLNDESGDLLDAYQAKKAFLTDTLLYGAGYFYVNRQRNKIKSLHYVSNRSVAVHLNSDPIYKFAEIHVNGRKYEPWEFIILTSDSTNGVTGKGVVDKNNDILMTAYLIYMYEKVLYKRGGSKRGFLSSEEKISDVALSALKDIWGTLFTNAEKDKPIIFNKGVEFKEISTGAGEMQMNENKETNSRQLCSLFNLSPKIIDGTATAEEFINGIKTAIIPIIT